MRLPDGHLVLNPNEKALRQRPSEIRTPLYDSEKKHFWKLKNGRCGDKNDCFCGKMSDFFSKESFQKKNSKKPRDKKQVKVNLEKWVGKINFEKWLFTWKQELIWKHHN